MVGGGSQKIDNLDAGDIELDFDDGQFISNHNGTHLKNPDIKTPLAVIFLFSLSKQTPLEVGDVRIL